jgi:hypothetical protein
MTLLNTFLVYSGALALALLFLYGIRDYWVTLFGGFAAFCVFYGSFGLEKFEWELPYIILLFKNAAIIYIVAFIIAVLIQIIIPLKRKAEFSAIKKAAP